MCLVCELMDSFVALAESIARYRIASNSTIKRQSLCFLGRVFAPKKSAKKQSQGMAIPWLQLAIQALPLKETEGLLELTILSTRIPILRFIQDSFTLTISICFCKK